MTEPVKTTSWNTMPVELKSIVMHDAPDLSSLLNLVMADPFVESELRCSFNTILPSVLARSMPRELQVLICMILIIREHGNVPNDQVEMLFNANLGLDEEKQVLRLRTRILNPMAALRMIIRTRKAVDYFTWAFARGVCQPPPTSLQTQQLEDPILSATETHRIHRGFWRFQICCELSSSWTASGELELALSGYDDRIPRLMMFLKRFNPWEIEELNCIYDFLEEMLERDPRDTRLDYLGNKVNPYALPVPRFGAAAPGQTTPGVKAKILSQGLTFLWTYLRRTLPRTRIRKEQTLYFPSDEFIIPAVQMLKTPQHRFSQISEIVISSNTCPWTDNYGANLANSGWSFFSAEDPAWLSSFGYLRQFGFCIWDSRRLSSWGVLNRQYGSALEKKLTEIRNPWATQRHSFYSFPSDPRESYLPYVY